MLTEEFIKYRLESLKMSYEIIFKIGNIEEYKYKEYYNKDDIKTKTKIRDDLQNVFELADIHSNYILNGILPSFDEEKGDENEII